MVDPVSVLPNIVTVECKILSYHRPSFSVSGLDGFQTHGPANAGPWTPDISSISNNINSSYSIYIKQGW